ncbi:GNAT family N-acetyltransferase [Microlunatus sp. Gsoil 973]|uniref:GNAT family N-acetyltransferase n=1 Tax=Microlunatus sp. Gsoil 973 TaxID=2672569 RepID=UPI0018A81982|nr:GNAT family N-acetyltransferase [Microlunatus sp. Gsoil 973]
MTGPTDEIEVRKNEQTRLYEAVAGDRVIGSLAYESVGGKTALTHSFVDPDRRHSGVGSALAEFALTDVTADGVRPVIYCGFVADYVDAHPQWKPAVEVSRWGMIPTSTGPSRPKSAE